MKKTTLLLMAACISLSLFSQTPAKPKAGKMDLQTYFYRPLFGKPFPLSQLTTLDHKSIDFHALHGKIVFVNFWFKECTGCMSEMEGLKKLHEKYKHQDVLYLMITYESPGVIREIQQKYGLAYQMASVDRNILSSFVHGYPSSFVIDSNGKVVYARAGANGEVALATKEVLDKFGPRIEVLLAKHK